MYFALHIIILYLHLIAGFQWVRTFTNNVIYYYHYYYYYY